MNYLKVMEAFVDECYDNAVADYRKLPSATNWTQLTAEMIVFQQFREAKRNEAKREQLETLARAVPVSEWSSRIVDIGFGEAVELEELVRRMSVFPSV
jgi:hypothetical protein